MKISIKDIKNKKGTEKIVCLTAYSFSIAKILDNFCDIILVGDSLGMMLYGFQDTIDVDLSMMINHGKSVVKASKRSLIVVDLPYGTYESSKEQALESAKKVIKETGCDAIKIETDIDLVDTVKFLVENKINVMGHVGLLPQKVRQQGGYKYQGKTTESYQRIIQTAKMLEKAGVFAIVIEAVPNDLACDITKLIKVPTIGIGASKDCDGQILVTDDVIGLNQEFKPKFVKTYDDISSKISKAVSKFAKDVKEKKFPQKNNLLYIKKRDC